MTRERVRQIEARACRNLKKYRFELPFLERAIKEIEQHTPMLDKDVGLLLKASEMSRGPFSASSLRKAADVLGQKWRLERVELKEARLLVKKPQREQFHRLLAALRQKTSELGCTSVMALVAEAEIEDHRTNEIVKFLDLCSRTQWLDDAKTWLFDKQSARNRLYNLCAKVLSVCPQIRISELRRAVSRARRLAITPPQRVIANFVSAQRLGRVDDEFIYGVAGIGAAPADDSVEGRMIKALDQFGPVMDGEEFAERSVAAGVNGTSFYIYRMISPLVAALGNGVFCKVGSDVPPGLVEDIITKRRTVSRISDHGWTETGHLWFGLELSLQLIVTGGIRMVSFVGDLVQGEWKVLLPDGSGYGTVQCKDVFIWSFRKAFGVLGAEAGDLAAFEFDLKRRTVLVRIGGPGLFEAVQEADAIAASHESEEV